MTGFQITDGKGIHITFDNGVKVSVQFGYGNYCENYDVMNDTHRLGVTSRNAEVAIFDKSGKWITKEYTCGGELDDDVIGRLSPAEVLDVLKWAEAHE